MIGWLVGSLGNAAGFPVAFGVMAGRCLLAAVAVVPIREPTRRAAGSDRGDGGGAIGEPW